MCKRKTLEEFKEQASERYDNFFDYSLIKEYKSNKDIIEIICPKHGVIKSTPSNHLKKKIGCFQCYNDKRRHEKKEKVKKQLRHSTEDFIRKAIKKHGDTFDYSISNYTGVSEEIQVICKNHGIINTTPEKHLYSKVGCKYCGIEKRNAYKKLNTEEFIKKAKEVHGDTYSYENTEYIRSNQKLIIICKHHGDYLQTPNAHLVGKGCEKCAVIYNAFIREDYVKKAKGRDTIIYILRCWNEEEEFYKIGKTFETVEKRYSYSKLPYSYEILDFKISDASTIHILEVELHKKYGMYRYSPKTPFGGHTECYKISLPLTNVLEL